MLDLASQWLCDQIGLHPTVGFRCLAKHDADNNITAAIGFDQWNDSAVELHWAGKPGYMTPRFLAAAFYYAYHYGHCKVIIVRIPSGNTESLEAVKRLGFIKVLSIADGHPDGYLHVYILRKENCALLKRYYHG